LQQKQDQQVKEVNVSMEITKTTVMEVSQTSVMSSSSAGGGIDDREFQEQYDRVMKEVIVLDNSLINKGQVTSEDLMGRPEEKTRVNVADFVMNISDHIT
jgi:hypothetical protein